MKGFKIILILVILIFQATVVDAAVSRFSVVNFRTNYGTGPFFKVRESQGLEKLGFNFGTTFDYSYRPLRATIFAPPTYNLINTLIVQHFYGSFGVADWLTVSADLPVVYYNRFTNPDTLASPSTRRDLGDLEFELKARLLDNERYPLGVSLVPFISVPTGNSATFVGNSGAAGGARLVFDKVINDTYTLALNLGFLGRKEFNAYGAKIGNQFLAGVGAAAKVVDDVSLSLELESSTTFSNFYSQKRTSPVELSAGIKWNIADSGFVLGASGGGGLVYGTGAPKVQAMGTFSYTHTPKKKKRVNRDFIISEIRKPIYFGFDSSALNGSSKKHLDEIVTILDENSWINKLVVNGFCDSVGATAYNKRLSQKRAKSVYEYIVKRIKGNLDIQYVGRGELPKATSEEVQKHNRKVEISVQN